MLTTEAVVAQIDPLIEQAESHTDRSDPMYGEYYKTTEADARSMRTRMMSAIGRLAPPGSAHRAQADEVDKKADHDSRKVVWLAGVLRALRDDYTAGYLQTVTELVHADLFADFLEMASELQQKNFKDPAAVLAGSVLEEHVRKLAAKSGIDVEKPDGSPKKADTINADLAREEVYSKLEQKSVTAWLALRNHAAHGEYDNYDHGQVAALIRDVRDFMIRNPA
jgi:pyruvate/2-oxoglutarate dehydrogenase complex dihydrolipoamide acyltransferase (E2) component